jgi:hypothetical protein
MRCSRIPEEQVAWIRADFDPLAVAVFQPLHSSLGEAIPLWGPGWNLIFPCHLLVELLAQFMTSFADDETAIVWTIGKEVDKPVLKSEKDIRDVSCDHLPLQAPEIRFERILILMWPRFVGWQIFPVWKAEVDAVKRHKKILVVVHGFESSNNTRL